MAFDLFFGIGPVPDATAKIAIVACVLVLFAIGALHVALERYYVRTDRAIEIDLSHTPPKP